MTLSLLLLAAGASRRFGGKPKQLHHWQGQPLICHVTRVAETVAPGRCLVVLGAYAQHIQASVSHLSTAVCEDWASGMGTTLAFGVERLPKDTTAVLVLLADQLAITEQDLRHLVQAFEAMGGGRCEPAIACASYQGVRGVPAIFSHHFFAQLCRLQGEQGAKFLLQTCDVVCVPMASAAVDIDTPADIEQFIKTNRETARAEANN